MPDDRIDFWSAEPYCVAAPYCVIEDCDFFYCTVNGEPMWDNTEPIVRPGNNIIWPKGWTLEQAKQWRQNHGLLPRNRDAEQ